MISLTQHRLACLRSARLGLALPLLLAASLAGTLTAQESLPRIWASPAATTSQTIGLAEVTVRYYRPAVKGREIFGSLVPYGELWRAGANQNTTISFTHDVSIEGQPLVAGTYGFHVIPESDRWTLIFNRNSNSWGSYFHKAEEDALRVEVTPESAPMQEWLSYSFDEPGRESARLVLRWDTLAVPVSLSFATDDLMVAYAQDVFLRGIPGFRWQGYNDAANYCLSRKVHLEQGLAWSEQSLRRGRNTTNLGTYANLLSALGRDEEASDALVQASQVASSEEELNALGYQLMQASRLTAALEAFKRNVLSFPASWNAHDSLGEAYAANGEMDAALSSYEQALALVEDAEQRNRIETVIRDMQAR